MTIFFPSTYAASCRTESRTLAEGMLNVLGYDVRYTGTGDLPEFGLTHYSFEEDELRRVLPPNRFEALTRQIPFPPVRVTLGDQRKVVEDFAQLKEYVESEIRGEGRFTIEVGHRLDTVPKMACFMALYLKVQKRIYDMVRQDNLDNCHPIMIGVSHIWDATGTHNALVSPAGAVAPVEPSVEELIRTFSQGLGARAGVRVLGSDLQFSMLHFDLATYRTLLPAFVYRIVNLVDWATRFYPFMKLSSKPMLRSTFDALTLAKSPAIRFAPERQQQPRSVGESLAVADDTEETDTETQGEEE